MMPAVALLARFTAAQVLEHVFERISSTASDILIMQVRAPLLTWVTHAMPCVLHGLNRLLDLVGLTNGEQDGRVLRDVMEVVPSTYPLVMYKHIVYSRTGISVFSSVHFITHKLLSGISVFSSVLLSLCLSGAQHAARVVESWP